MPEALLPEPEVLAEELRVAVVAEERRVVPDCGVAVEVLPLLRETLLPDPLVPVVELRRFCPLCTAEELLREALLPWVAAAELRDTPAAEERVEDDERETLEEDAPLSRVELTLVLEDLVAELPELVPVALRLACAFKASGVNAIAIARTVTIRVLTKVFIRLIDIIFFGD